MELGLHHILYIRFIRLFHDLCFGGQRLPSFLDAAVHKAHECPAR